MNRLLYILLLLFVSTSIVRAQDRPLLDREKWEKTTDGVTFTEKRPPPIEKATQDSPTDLSWLSGLGIIFKIILLLLLVALVGFIIYQLSFVTKSNKKIPNGSTPLNLDDFEEHIDELNFEQVLANALQNKEYKLAIRVYFLIALQNLNQSNRILWSNEKTNQDYLFEMHEDTEFASFRKLILQFEIAWYSERHITAELFEKIAPEFKGFIERTAPSK